MYDKACGCPYGCKCDFDGLCFMYANVDVMQCFWFFVYLDDMLWGNGA